MPAIIALIIIFGTAIGVITFFLIKTVIAPKRVATLVEYHRQGKYAAAIRMARQIIAKEPRNSEAHYLLGLSYLGDNKPELALMELKTVNQIGKFGGACPEVDFRNSIARLYARYGQIEEALKEYLLLMRLEPMEADYYYQSALLFEERNKSDKAIGFYRKTIEVAPRHSNAHYRLGYLLYRNKKPVEAKVELETAIKFKPENYTAYFYLGRLLKDNHDYVSALHAFERAQRDPDMKVKALIERGGCYMSMNNFEKAVTELERGIKLSRDESAMETIYGRYFLALCYEKMREIDMAVEQWEKIYSKKPQFRDVAEKLSQYQDLRTDDRLKDYLTAGSQEFQEMCKATCGQLGLRVRDLSDIPNGCQIIAVDDDTRWRNTRKLPRLLHFLRIPEMIPESTVRNFHELMKKYSVQRGILVSSSNFSRVAMDFVESRPIDLVDKDKLQELLKGIELPGAAVKR
ncbi:tetratricopeptide repeat protein [Marispirochaeta aestuarii]|uniref:tetratricopeptide repeat protein n=1 Tax=Marispirochaeta aestuarii TaxID=1963862 RepID=UPI0029C8D592|nr:tetratricopeptide repeat protein [Marispirochaeta aestuarii]